jgi:hypothetical protein
MVPKVDVKVSDYAIIGNIPLRLPTGTKSRDISIHLINIAFPLTFSQFMRDT